MKYAVGLALSAVLSLWFVFGQEPEDPYEKGLRIIKEHGARRGIEYFRNLAIEEDSAKAIYYYGWAWYREGNVTEAEEITEFLLTKIDKESFIAGHCHYLMAQIWKREFQWEQALGHSENAVSIYKRHNKQSSLFRTYCTIASIYILKKDFEKADAALEDAINAHQVGEKSKKLSLEYYYELMARIASAKKDNQKALDFSIKSWEAYVASGDETRATHALSGVGFYKILTGRIKEGLDDTEAVDKIVKSSEGYVMLSYYNLVNWVVAYRCSGNEYQSLVDEINTRIQSHNDQHLKEHLDFALKWNCGREE